MLTLPRRIAYVITDLETGGVPLHLARLAVAVRDRGYEPHVVSLAPCGPVERRIRKENIRTCTCEAAGPRDISVVFKLARRLREIRPRFVHAFLFHANMASRLAVRLAGLSPRRLICEIQTAEIERTWHLTLGGMTHRMGRCVVGNAPSVVEHLRRCAHMAPARLRCIPGGIDMQRIETAPPADRAPLGFADDASIVLWVGRLDPVKGLDELINAFAAVVTKANACLVLAGDGPYRAHLQELIEARELSDRVKLLGRRDDVPSLLKLADVFAFPSYTEGMPNALLEAMAAERPIVATDVPGNRDLITHEQTGLLVPARDAHALSLAISKLLDDRKRAKEWAAGAAAKVRLEFTFHKCVERYIDLYRTIEA